MGQRITLSCDRAGCDNQHTGSPGMTTTDIANQYDWTIEFSEAGKLIVVCPSCAGLSEGTLVLVNGGRNMLVAMRRFDGNSDCYATPCQTQLHDGDGCLVHVFNDEDPDMLGAYVRIIDSGCGLYQAEMLSPTGEVLMEADSKVWWE